MVDLAQQLQAIRSDDPGRRKAERTLMAGFPAHVDSSLLTIAPRGTVSGLSVRDYATDKYIRIERCMADDEAVLFCGDPLSFLSGHRLPACMHRPDGLEMARQAPATRLSTPFFLYAAFWYMYRPRGFPRTCVRCVSSNEIRAFLFFTHKS